LKQDFKINWIQQKRLDLYAHGIELYHKKIVSHADPYKAVAFIWGFESYHGESDNVDVRIIEIDSQLFSELNVNGEEIVEEVKREIVEFLSERVFP